MTSKNIAYGFWAQVGDFVIQEVSHIIGKIEYSYILILINTNIKGEIIGPRNNKMTNVVLFILLSAENLFSL